MTTGNTTTRFQADVEAQSGGVTQTGARKSNGAPSWPAAAGMAAYFDLPRIRLGRCAARVSHPKWIQVAAGYRVNIIRILYAGAREYVGMMTARSTDGAAILDLDARQAAQSQANEVEALRGSVYREAFEGIVPVAVPPDFEDRPAGWRWVQLVDLARLESGHTPSRSRSDWWGGDISWVSLTEIRALDGRWIEQTRLRTNPAGIANSAARVLPRGTVCFSRTASVGFVVIMDKPMATSQDFANWVCGDDLDPDFLMHALIRSRKELRAIATGATHKTIYMPALESFRLCLPERTAQERIVHRLRTQLEAIETMRQTIRARLADLERLPARLLAEAFHPSNEEIKS